MWNLWSNQSLFRWKFRSHLASHGHKSFDWRQVSKHLLFFVMVKKNTRSLKKQEGGGGGGFFFFCYYCYYDLETCVCTPVCVFCSAYLENVSNLPTAGSRHTTCAKSGFFFLFWPSLFPSLFLFSLLQFSLWTSCVPCKTVAKFQLFVFSLWLSIFIFKDFDGTWRKCLLG